MRTPTLSCTYSSQTAADCNDGRRNKFDYAFGAQSTTIGKMLATQQYIINTTKEGEKVAEFIAEIEGVQELPSQFSEISAPLASLQL